MKIKSLRMQNFRGFEDSTLEFDDQLTVLIGANGAGKSSVLDCLGILLSRIIARIGGLKESTMNYSEMDIKLDRKNTVNSLAVNYFGNRYTWTTARNRKGFKKIVSSDLNQARKLVDIFYDNFDNSKGFCLPLISYYNISRNVYKTYLSKGERKKFGLEQIAAWDQAITRKVNNFQLFLEWFRYQESIELEERFEKTKEMLGSDIHKTTDEFIKEVRNQDDGMKRAFDLYLHHEDKLLRSVRKAVESFMPDYKAIRVKRKESKLVVTNNGKEFYINQLSDGEKNTIAMIGDIARRLAIANPGLDDPLQGTGIVMIDEIELHLHPKWQRMIIPRLTETFPNLQFIVTTHSPQVLSHVKKEWTVYSLVQVQEENTLKAYKEDNIFGADSNWLLRNVMKDRDRPKEVNKVIDELFDFIDSGDLVSAKLKRTELENMPIGNYDQILAKADVLIRRKEILSE